MYELNLQPIRIDEPNKKYPKAALGADIIALLDSPWPQRIEELAKSAELDILKIGRELYNIKLQTKEISLSNLCLQARVFAPSRSQSFYRGTYNIYKHFVILCNYQLEDLLGINYKILRFIAESAQGTFDQETTWETIHKIKNKHMSSQAVWAYVKNVKITRQNDLKMAAQFSGVTQNA
ncbi:MAG: hypothetical protein H8E14_08340 [Candidatus Marinimicrobia bacterium]|nr:hypothetical protein [Candidatus Neomarinimicrobiota bacterium]